MTSATGGTVDIVDATSLQSKLDALSSPIVGTNVTVTVRASGNVVVADPSSLSSGVGRLSAELPAVKAESGEHSALMLFYVIKSKTDWFFELRVPSSAASPLFVQTEITWTALDGSVYSRVSNRRVSALEDRAAVEKNSDLAVAAIAALRECAALAARNEIQNGRIVLISTMRLLQVQREGRVLFVLKKTCSEQWPVSSRSKCSCSL